MFLAGAWSPTSFIMKLGSIFASTVGSSGENPTTRICAAVRRLQVTDLTVWFSKTVKTTRSAAR
jgi:hypothetical protein